MSFNPELSGLILAEASLQNVTATSGCVLSVYPACAVEAAHRGWELGSMGAFIRAQVAGFRATEVAEEEALQYIGGSTTVVLTGGLQVLLPFTDLSYYKVLLFSLTNQGSGVIDLYVETSQVGAIADRVGNEGDADNPIIVQPGASGSLEVGPEQIRRWWRMSAQGTGPIQWEVVGLFR